jgi:hypothetical protein
LVKIELYKLFTKISNKRILGVVVYTGLDTKIMKNSEISLYVDSLIAEIIIADGIITKTASGSKINEMASKISSFFTPQFDNASDFGDKAVNFLGFIAPGAIFFTFRKLNMPWIGALLGLAASMFRVPVKEVLSIIFISIYYAIGGGIKLTSGQVDSIVVQSVNSGMASSAPEIESEDSEDFDLSSFNSLNMTLRQAKLIKLAMLQEQDNLYKFALGRPSLSPSKKPFFTKFAFGSILRSVLSWFFKIALASAGFMVAGDVVNSLIGRHSDSLSDKFVTDDKIKRQQKLNKLKQQENKTNTQIGKSENGISKIMKGREKIAGNIVKQKKAEGKQIGANSKKEKGNMFKSIGAAAPKIVGAMSSIPIAGPAIGLALVGTMAALAESFLGGGGGDATEANDLLSPAQNKGGYGDRVLLSPEGTFSFNNRDTILAGTDLTPVNDFKSGPAGSVSGDTKNAIEKQKELIAEVKKTNQLLNQILRKEGTVSIDGNKVGNAVGMSTSRLR